MHRPSLGTKALLSLRTSRSRPQQIMVLGRQLSEKQLSCNHQLALPAQLAPPDSSEHSAHDALFSYMVQQYRTVLIPSLDRTFSFSSRSPIWSPLQRLKPAQTLEPSQLRHEGTTQFTHQQITASTYYATRQITLGKTALATISFCYPLNLSRQTAQSILLPMLYLAYKVQFISQSDPANSLQVVCLTQLKARLIASNSSGTTRDLSTQTHHNCLRQTVHFHTKPKTMNTSRLYCASPSAYARADVTNQHRPISHNPILQLRASRTSSSHGQSKITKPVETQADTPVEQMKKKAVSKKKKAETKAVEKKKKKPVKKVVTSQTVEAGRKISPAESSSQTSSDLDSRLRREQKPRGGNKRKQLIESSNSESTISLPIKNFVKKHQTKRTNKVPYTVNDQEESQPNPTWSYQLEVKGFLQLVSGLVLINRVK
ncbi:T-complex protein 1 subunit delta-like [Dorcoceras hygrometricum]|uniref:T-complex protein 1 subunit delta-like n=1 Tax=Dorcoceras hygrometricum TaxID=472368 RepID=A0A2Z7CGV4_9LAMI|nr:T-complex protein 1 subunit delta-like [Dorcoceras hygrometricum]